MAGLAEFEVDVKGLAELQRALMAAPGKVRGNVQRKGLRKGIKIAQERAKQLVPVDSGKLKRQLKVRAAPRKRGRIGVRIVAEADSRKSRKDDAFYGSFVEFGHFIGSRKLQNRVWVPPNPFLRRSFKQSKPRMRMEVLAAFREGLREAFRK